MADKISDETFAGIAKELEPAAAKIAVEKPDESGQGIAMLASAVISLKRIADSLHRLAERHGHAG